MNEETVNHAAKNDPSKFDWITERSSCSLPNIFKKLRLQVEEDVKTRNALRPANSPYEFSVAESNGGFAVLLKAKDAQRSVVFALTEHAISVRDGLGSPMFDVTIVFDDAGKCRLIVNAEPLDFWQVRRMALEELLFRGL